MTAFFSASDTKGMSIPAEYRKMKFCEVFHVSPFEYENMPSKEVDAWLTIKSLENQFESAKMRAESNKVRKTRSGR